LHIPRPYISLLKVKVKFRIGAFQHRSPRLIVLSPRRSSFIHL
jgi:hypothetical protein